MVNPAELKLFYEPKDRLRLTLGEEKSYLTVKPVWAAPVSRPGAYLALLDGKGEEIALLQDLNALSPENAAILQAELRQRYLTALVRSITHARQEYGATYWSVETDRGPRDFVTQSLQENAQWFSETHLLLLDVDGNRFEIPDVTALDARSQAIIGAIL
ncbi:MAG TPA: DUF1854 domain-containing protein [Chthonomonadaceae bacterium]|nr:DUF1854 domain-containing protein [Chthonomonadaceae bacterium]